MTRKVGNTIHFEAEELQRCELCGAVEETRPYGPNGEEICYPCGMKNKETTIEKFHEFMDGPGEKSQ